MNMPAFTAEASVCRSNALCAGYKGAVGRPLLANQLLSIAE